MTTTDRPHITAVAVTTLTSRLAEIVGVSYDVDSLRVEMRDLRAKHVGKSPSLESKVSSVLDEDDLGEFWGHVPGLVSEATAGG